jgi:hypothetical protein
MDVCCECCVLSGRCLCDEVMITRPEESYRLWRVVVCDQETSWTRRPWPAAGPQSHENKQTGRYVKFNKQQLNKYHLCKYRCSRLFSPQTPPTFDTCGHTCGLQENPYELCGHPVDWSWRPLIYFIRARTGTPCQLNPVHNFTLFISIITFNVSRVHPGHQHGTVPSDFPVALDMLCCQRIRLQWAEVFYTFPGNEGTRRGISFENLETVDLWRYTLRWWKRAKQNNTPA